MKSITEHMNEAMGLVTEANTMTSDIYWEDSETAVDAVYSLADDLEEMVSAPAICKALRVDPDDLGDESKMFTAIVMGVAAYIRSIASMVENGDEDISFLQAVVTSVGPKFIGMDSLLDDIYNQTGEDLPVKYVETFFKKYWNKILKGIFHRSKWA